MIIGDWLLARRHVMIIGCGAPKFDLKALQFIDVLPPKAGLVQ